MEKYRLNINPVLQVRNLEKQLHFYLETIGLELVWRKGVKAALGDAKGEVIMLAESHQVDTQFGVKINVENRRELARIVGRLCTIGYKNHALDRGDQHVIRLFDLEANPIEIGVSVKNNTPHESCSLDIETLLNELHPDDRLCDKIMSCRITVLNETEHLGFFS